ncbi:hypothetical protein [Streptacidiphilus sp. PAMC 29251]
MSRPTIIGDGPEREAADPEIAEILGGLTTLDGTNILDMWLSSQDEDGEE